MIDTFRNKSRTQTFFENLLAMVAGCLFLSLPFLLPVAAVAFGIGGAYECHKAQLCIQQEGTKHVKNRK